MPQEPEFIRKCLICVNLSYKPPWYCESGCYCNKLKHGLEHGLAMDFHAKHCGAFKEVEK